MPDLLADIFDPAIPVTRFTPAVLRAVPPAQVKRRLGGLLRAHELSGERVALVASLLQTLGVKRHRDTLAAICADDAVPVTSRAAPAFLLFNEDLDPGVPPSEMPALAEAVVLGAAILSDPGLAAPLIVALVASGPACADDVITRIERWRSKAVIPALALYGDALRSRTCTHAHERILALLEDDPETLATVAALVASGVVDDALGAAFLGREPRPRQSAAVRVWSGPDRSDGAGRDFSLVIEGEAGDTHLSMRLGPDEVMTVLLMPLVSRSGSLEVELGLDEHPGISRGGLSQLRRWAATARAITSKDRRVLWLLRQLDLQGRDDDVAFDPSRAYRSVPGLVAALAGGSPSEDELENAVDALTDAAGDGHLHSAEPEPGGIAAATWTQLLAEVVGQLERLELAWGRTDLPFAATTTLTSLWRAGGDDTAALLPEARWDRLVWRELLACVVMDVDLADLLGVHGARVARLARTPADVARELGAPDNLAAELAEKLGIAPDEPIRHAPRR